MPGKTPSARRREGREARRMGFRRECPYNPKSWGYSFCLRDWLEGWDEQDKIEKTAERKVDESRPRRWRHVKRGTTYVELGRAEGQSAAEERIVNQMDFRVEGQRFVCYRSEDDDSLWVRPEAEFMDGRFEEIT